MKVIGHGESTMKEHYLKERRLKDVETIFRMNDRLRLPPE
jgi:hypothetical protein